MDAIGKLCVFTNSMIIAFTTDIIPEMLYFLENGFSSEGYYASTLSVYQITPLDPPNPNGDKYCL